MSFPFDAEEGLILVRAKLWGVRGDTFARLALDTGATFTAVSPHVLEWIGYTPDTAQGQFKITTASRSVVAARFFVSKFEVLGQTRLDFPILAHSLPSGASVDGVLGLDFMRGKKLTVDFRAGTVTLE